MNRFIIVLSFTYDQRESNPHFVLRRHVRYPLHHGRMVRGGGLEPPLPGYQPGVQPVVRGTMDFRKAVIRGGNGCLLTLTSRTHTRSRTWASTVSEWCSSAELCGHNVLVPRGNRHPHDVSFLGSDPTGAYSRTSTAPTTRVELALSP